jgi:N,N'-diacetyllegionaminate synthase
MKIAEYQKAGKVFIIAEIAQAHEGSLGILHSLVKAIASIGVDAVKFQVHIAEAESSLFEPFRIPFSLEDKTRFEYWKRMEFSLEQWRGVKELCDNIGVEFLATPFSAAAVDLLEKLNVKRYKIGSADAGNLILLEKVARTGKEVIFSTGLAEDSELENVFSFFKERKLPITLLHCITKYPCEAKEINLRRIMVLKSKFNCPIGYSDHSGTVFPALGAVAMGASVIEAHITFDKRMFGPDAEASLTIDEFKILVKGTRFLEAASQQIPDTGKISDTSVIKGVFSRSLSVNRDMQSGEILRFEDLESKKAFNNGIAVEKLYYYLGKKLTNNKNKWDILQESDF